VVARIRCSHGLINTGKENWVGRRDDLSNAGGWGSKRYLIYCPWAICIAFMRVDGLRCLRACCVVRGAATSWVCCMAGGEVELGYS